MENREITKELKCVVVRGGLEIWKEQDRLDDLGEKLVGGQKIGFIKVDDEIINSVDIVGIFNAQTMEDLTRRKNGQWQNTKTGEWHNRGDRVCSGCDRVIPSGKQCGYCY